MRQDTLKNVKRGMNAGTADVSILHETLVRQIGLSLETPL